MELARLEIDGREEEKLLKDLQKIVGYFDELKELDIESTEPMTGGTDLNNVFRDDKDKQGTNLGSGTNGFPETNDDNFLKIPPVFE